MRRNRRMMNFSYLLKTSGDRTPGGADHLRRPRPTARFMAGIVFIASVWMTGDAAAAPSAGQRSRHGAARLEITVLDPSGASVPHARLQWLPAKGKPAAAQPANAHGQVQLNSLRAGKGQLLISAPGFRSRRLSLRLHSGNNRVKARLALAEVVQQMTVRVNHALSLTSPNSTAFSFVLTPQTLQQLPDDPDQFQAALTAMAGPGAGPTRATMRVDGFGGGQLPPKSQIQSVQFNLNPYTAAYHTATGIRIIIHTKPGIGAWHG